MLLSPPALRTPHGVFTLVLFTPRQRTIRPQTSALLGERPWSGPISAPPNLFFQKHQIRYTVSLLRLTTGRNPPDPPPGPPPLPLSPRGPGYSNMPVGLSFCTGHSAYLGCCPKDRLRWQVNATSSRKPSSLLL